MRAFLPILGLCAAVSVVAGHLLAWGFGMPQPSIAPPLFMLSLAIIGFGGAASLAGYTVWLALWEREPNPRPRVIATIRRYLSADFLAQRIAPLVLAFLILSTFNTFKVFIPRLNPFFLDGFLSDLDRWVLGADAWRLTHAVIGPVGTRVLDAFYGLWFPAWVIAIMHFSLFADRELQRRFFLSFIGVWAILGIGLAILLSSAGPCFLELIHHPYAERYAGLFPLHDAPGAARAQEYLGNAYLTGEIGLAKGISAMPSVHVAVVALLVLAVRSYGRWIFASTLFLYMMVFVGSIHLGWHYVSDGVVGTVGAVMLWRLTRLTAKVSAADATGPVQLQQS
jgi:hypothetical protein